MAEATQQHSSFGYVLGLAEGAQRPFFELQDGGCRVGAFIMKSDWERWQQVVRDGFKMGSPISVLGRVVEFQGQLELQLIDPPLP